MKRVDLEKALRRGECEFVRHGRSHDLWWNPSTGATEAIPRHREVDERLAKKILKALNVQPC